MTRHHTDRRVDKPPANQSSRFGAEDFIITMTVFLGFGGGIFLAILKATPPVLVALLLAAGLSALVHRFLGGLTGAEFTFGALKLVGTMGTLMTVFFVLNFYLAKQQKPYDEDMSGNWRWRYHAQGWLADLNLSRRGTSDDYSVTGKVRHESDDKLLYEITGGTAHYQGEGLLLDLNVKDYIRSRQVIWRTTKPLQPLVSFAGFFNARDKQTPEVPEPEPWGIFLVRVP